MARRLEAGEDFVITSAVGGHVRFGAGWTVAPDLDLDLDISCLMLDAHGAIKDAIFYGNMLDASGAVRHLGDDVTGEGCAKTEDEQISVSLNELPTDVAALVFMLNASTASDLSRTEDVFFRVRDAKNEPLVETVLSKECRVKETHSVLSLALYRTGDVGQWDGWCMRFLLEPHSEPSWGELIPEAKKALLFAFPGMNIDPSEFVAIMRKSEDRPLDDIANFRLVKNGQEPTHVTSIRIDVGWTVLASAGVDKVDMDTNVILTDDKGAVVGEVNFNNKEEKGIKLLGDERNVDAASDDKKPAKFPVHEQVVATLTEVDPKVKNIVIFITNYSGTGFTQLESVRCRFVETATGQDLSVFSVDCRQGEASGKKTVMVGKLYRDNISSAFHDWKFAQTQDSELSLEAVHKMQAQRGLPAFDEDAGLSIPEWEQKSEIQWRVRGLGQFCYGETIAEATPAAVAVAVYDGRRDGEGLRHDRRARCCYPNGDSYYGQYTHGKRDGMGIYMFRYGSAYHGIFKDGHLQEGTMEHPDGGKYVGQYMKDKMEGEGTYIYPGGDKYSGHWVSGKKEGHGRYEYANGTVLEGDWKNGQPDGNLKYDESTTYKGAGKFKNGIPLGPWQFQSKKTGLKQEGQYKYKPVGWSGEGEPPKPLPPKWKGLSWVGKGLPHADAPDEAPPEQSSTST